MDLPSEEAARGRRKAAKATRITSASTSQTQREKSKARGPKIRKFNMQTYKMHALGDYARCIRLFGASDGYSTQTVHIPLPSPVTFLICFQGELEHRRCKRFYPRVHKGKKHYKQGIAKHVQREHNLHNIGQELDLDMNRPAKRHRVLESVSQPGDRVPQAPQLHYQLPEQSRNIFMLDSFLRENRRDPAVKV